MTLTFHLQGPHGRREPHVPKVSVKYLTTKDFPKGSGDSLGFKAGQEVEVRDICMIG